MMILLLLHHAHEVHSGADIEYDTSTWLGYKYKVTRLLRQQIF